MLNFPINPTTGDLYQTGSSATYEFNGSYWTVVTPTTDIRLTANSASFATTSNSASYVNALNQDVTISGKLGIGTTTPATQLHLKSPNELASVTLENTAGSKWSIRPSNPGVNNTGLVLYDELAAAARVRVDAAGNVGIGITEPIAKLHVNGSSNIGAQNYAWLANNGVVSTAANSILTDVSIYGTGDIAAGGVVLSISDEREKKDIEDIGYGLETVMNIRPTEYVKKDHVQHGGRKELGFIAQEIEQILPEVVSTTKGDVAVMKRWEDFTPEDGVTYNLIIKDQEGEVKWMKGDDVPEGEIFVKSMDVEDKRSVSYDAIVPVLTKAIQEQQKMIEELQAKIEILENK